jgi:hypothetical protein
VRSLSLVQAAARGVPLAIDAILVASDLQGRELPRPDGSPPRLLGQVLADDLATLAELGAVPATERTGVLLGGDLYADEVSLRRGSTGDVRPVWHRFARLCRWVVGVAGNHDAFGTSGETEVEAGAPWHVLDGQVIDIDGLRMGGVSGVVGNPRRPFRRDEAAFIATVRRVLARGPDVLILHEGPDVPAEGLRGHAPTREALVAHGGPLLVVRGHDHWPVALAELAPGIQVLNADERALLLRRSTSGQAVGRRVAK